MQTQFKQTVLEIRFLELQFARSPSTGFEPAALIHANHVLCIADVVKWSRAMDIRLTDWCCSASMLLVQILLRENEQTVTPKISTNQLALCPSP
jgi:hypothetical protein